MKVTKRALALLAAWMLALCCIQGSVSGAAWAEEETQTAPQTEQALEMQEQLPLGVNDLIVQQELERQEELAKAFENTHLDGSFCAEYDFGGVQHIRGIYSVLCLYAELPDYAAPTTAMIRVCYTASDLILSDLSSLTFYMNGTPFYSTYVVVNQERTSTVVYVPVPVNLLVPGYNLLEISAYVRLTDNEGCTDDYSGANWIRFEEATCLRIAYELSDKAGELSVFPYPFLSMADKTGADCAVAVSDVMDDSELTAAMNLMADFGTALSGKNEVEVTRISDTDRRHVIYFGLKDNTPARLLALLDQEVPETGALLQRATDGTRDYLLVVAQENAALLEAARLLSDSTRVKQLHGSKAQVSVGEARVYTEAGMISALAVEGQYTIREMLSHGISFVGPFHQVATIYLPVPEDYVLSSEGKFTFHIRYSENLDWDRSLMTVYWGNTLPLYSRKLTKDGAAGETVAFSVPSDAVGASGTYLTIVFDLEVKDLDCTPRQLNMPWAYIAEDSVLYLPQGEKISLSLSNRPAPFQRNSRMNDVLVILPTIPEKDDLILAGRAVAMLGAGSTPYGTLNVIRAYEFSEAVHGNCNLVLVGKPGANAMIATLNSVMHFRYTEDLTRYESNDKVILNDSYAAETGVIQLQASPYAANRAVLMLSAPGEEGIRAVIERISDDKQRWALTKEAVLVDTHGQASSFQFTATTSMNASDEKPSFQRVVMANREPILLTLIGLGSMLLVFIGMLILALRARRRNRGSRE